MRLMGRYLNSSEKVLKLQKLIDRARSENVERIHSPAPTKRARRLSSTEIDELVARYHQLRNIRAVARELSLSRTTVAKHLNDRGVETSKRMSDADIALATQLYEEGLSSMVIGARLGFDNKTIISALRQSGVMIRKPLGE